MNNRFLPRTLRARLTALIFLSTSIILALSGAALFEAQRNRMDEAAEEHMESTLESVRVDLLEVRSTGEIAGDAHAWIDLLRGHQNMDMAIYDMAGQRLVSTSSFQPQARLFATPAENQKVEIDPDESGLRYLVKVVRLAGPDSVSVRVMVQYDTSGDAVSLRVDAAVIILIEVLGVALAAAFAYGIAMLGLSPLRRFVAHAEEMSSSRLAHPLSEPDASGELKELEHAFNGMLERLNDSFTRLSQFSSNLAHDMRTPLTNLQAAAQVALTLPRSAAEYRDVIESSIEEYRRLADMIDDMLFLARSEDAHSLVEVRRLDAVSEAERVAGYYEPMAEDAGVAIHVKGRATIYADLLLYQRALSNLLTNALAHAPRGSAIVVNCGEEDRASRIAVTDTGPGIESHHLERIFERFYRVDPSRRNPAPGTGLGLAIVKSIMDSHGGQCGVESRPGVRTTFWLSFPRKLFAQNDLPPSIGPMGF